MQEKQVLQWDGNPRRDALFPEYVQDRDRLADSARQADWETVLEILREHQDWVNTTRLGGTALFTPLHHAAYNGAPLDVVEKLLSMGAWRAARDKDGKLPVDIAKKKKQAHLFKILEPLYRQDIPADNLQAIQQNFHAVITNMVGDLVTKNRLRLPELEPLTEYEPQTTCWFAVPEMYGGFHFWLEKQWDSTFLISESWCRVVGGSGARYLVTQFGSVLVDKGFV